jgi:hypothetical protein
MKSVMPVLVAIGLLANISCKKNEPDQNLTGSGSQPVPIPIPQPTQPITGSLDKPLWSFAYGGSEHDFLVSSVLTADGGVISAGWSESRDGDITGNKGGVDVWAVRLDATGNLVWQNSYGGNNGDEANKIIATSDGNFLIAGLTWSNFETPAMIKREHDVYLVKIGISGNVIWQKSLGGSSGESADDIIETKDGGFMVVGSASSRDGDVTGNFPVEEDAWLLKLDKNGTIQWQKTYGGKSDEGAFSVVQAEDGGYLVSGVTNNQVPDNSLGQPLSREIQPDLWIFKVDANGKGQWQGLYGGSGREYKSKIISANDGYLVAIESSSQDGQVSSNHGDSDIWLLKLDHAGKITWQKSIGGSAADGVDQLIQTADGFLISGSTRSSNGDFQGTGNRSSGDGFIMKLNPSGNILWKKTFGGSGEDHLTGVLYKPDGSYLAAGYTTSPGTPRYRNKADYWVIAFKE